MRIYELDSNFHVDLGRIVAIRQYMKRTKQRNRNGRLIYDCWIEITISSGASINVDCKSIEDMQDTYNMLLAAWRSHVGDMDGNIDMSLATPYNQPYSQAHTSHNKSQK